MTPTGIAFTLFLALVLVAHWALPRRAAWQNAWLVIASYAFYVTWSPEWLWLLVAGTMVDWAIALRIASPLASPRLRRLLLSLSLTLSLGALAWFKYRGFFAESLGGLLESLGLGRSPVVLAVALPIGISYYTLIRVGYMLDVYHARVAACRSLLTFAAFTAFFPQVVAGPITRARQMLPQLSAPRRPNSATFAAAGGALLLGWFMKGYVADWIAPALVDPVFAAPGSQGAAAHWLALGGYAAQVFCDFAGYSLLAIGTARLFSLELPANFDRPFLSRSMPEFWRRWHISLNTWLFDHLYGPWVTGRGPLHGRVATALVIVFAISGLWHGARWTFVAWGVLHGLALAIHHHWDAWYRARCRVDRRWVTARRSAAYAVGAWVLTQAWFVGTLVLFRSDTPAATAAFVSGLAGAGRGFALALDEVAMVNLLVAFGFVAWHHIEGTVRGGALRGRFLQAPSLARGMAYGLVIAWLLVFAPLARGTFIYSQF